MVAYAKGIDTPVKTVQVDPTSNSTTVSGLGNGTAYDFDVAAQNEAKPRPGLPGTSNATKPAGRPLASESIQAAVLGAETVKLSWTTPSSDNGARITAYRISTAPDCPACTGLEVGGKDRSTVVTGLEPNTTYAFQVQSVNRKGSSFWSTSIAHANTPVDPAALPPGSSPRAPISVQVSKQNVFYQAPETKQDPAEGIAGVTWTAPPVGPVPTSYIVVATAGVARIESAPVTDGLSVQLRGLDTDLSYDFAVIARNGEGDSPTAHTGSTKSILGQMDEIMNQSVPQWRVTWASHDHPSGIPVGPQEDPGFMWDSDGCSSLLAAISPTIYDLEDSCYRHDFGYHNYGHRLGLAVSETFRQEVNDRFLEDMYYQCNEDGTVGKGGCMGVAAGAWFFVEQSGDRTTFYDG